MKAYLLFLSLVGTFSPVYAQDYTEHLDNPFHIKINKNENGPIVIGAGTDEKYQAIDDYGNLYKLRLKNPEPLYAEIASSMFIDALGLPNARVYPILVKRGFNSLPLSEEAKQYNPLSPKAGLAGKNPSFFFPATIQAWLDLKPFQYATLTVAQRTELLANILIAYVLGNHDIQLREDSKGNIVFDGNHFYLSDATQAFKFYNEDTHLEESFRHFIEILPENFWQNINNGDFISHLSKVINRMEQLNKEDLEKIFNPYFKSQNSFNHFKNLPWVNYLSQLEKRLLSLRPFTQEFLLKKKIDSRLIDTFWIKGTSYHKPFINLPILDIKNIRSAQDALWNYYFNGNPHDKVLANTEFKNFNVNHEDIDSYLSQKKKIMTPSNRYISPDSHLGSFANNHNLLSSLSLQKNLRTLVVVPNNDLEAQTIFEISKKSSAHSLFVNYPHGGKLDHPLMLQIESYIALHPEINKILVVELPKMNDMNLEQTLITQYPLIRFTFVDHHSYQGLDRSNKLSSLEQIAFHLGYTLNQDEKAIAIADRSFIGGLIDYGLSQQDVVEKYFKTSLANIELAIHSFENHLSVYEAHGEIFVIVDNYDIAISEAAQLFSLKYYPKKINLLIIKGDRLRFSGSPFVIQELSKKIENKYHSLKNHFKGGDPSYSMYWGLNADGIVTQEDFHSYIDFFKQKLSYDLPLKNNNHISTKYTRYDDYLAQKNFLPLGSALLTSSGHLEEKGIHAIIHAATGSMTLENPAYYPSLQSIGWSVENALNLAIENGYTSIAVPFVGGKIFAEKISRPLSDIAQIIVQSAQKYHARIEVKIIAFGEDDYHLFKKIDDKITVLNGSIIDFNLHKCPVIVNPANIEVAWGGGLSQIIGEATNQQNEINLWAQKSIQDFYKNHCNSHFIKGTR